MVRQMADPGAQLSKGSWNLAHQGDSHGTQDDCGEPQVVPVRPTPGRAAPVRAQPGTQLGGRPLDAVRGVSVGNWVLLIHLSPGMAIGRLGAA